MMLKRILISSAAILSVVVACKARQDRSNLLARDQGSIPEKLYQRILQRGLDPTAARFFASQQSTGKPVSYEDSINLIFSRPEFVAQSFSRLQKKRLTVENDLQDLETEEKGQGYNSIAKDEAGPDYCALSMDLEQHALTSDAAGDFWAIATSDERWLALPATITEGPLSFCYFGTPANLIGKMLTTGYNIEGVDANIGQMSGEDGPFALSAYTAAHPSDPNLRAKICAFAISKEIPANRREKNGQIPFIPELMAALKSAYQTGTSQALLDTNAGRAILESQLRVMYEFDKRRGVDLTLVGNSAQLQVFQDSSCNHSQQRASEIMAPAVRARFSEVTRSYLTFWYKMRPSYIAVRAKTQGIPGIHGSPYWLSRVPSNEKNRQLHRARVIFDTYFCQQVTPDSANSNGVKAIVPPSLLPIFGDIPGANPEKIDRHVSGAKNCFDCHANIQPVGNFFLGLTDGRKYGIAPQKVDGAMLAAELTTLGAERFFSSSQSLNELPGGLWQWSNLESGTGAFKYGPTAYGPSVTGAVENKGLVALGEMLKGQSKPLSCVVTSAWENIFPDRSLELDQKQMLAGVLRDRGFTSMLKSMLIKVPQAREALLNPSSAPAQRTIDCKGKSPQTFSTALTSHCETCHDDNTWKPTNAASIRFAVGDNKYIEGPSAWQNIYCQVESGNMPQGGADSMSVGERQDIMCQALRGINATVAGDQLPALDCSQMKKAKPATHKM